jgi:adenylate kinase family enzyme
VIWWWTRSQHLTNGETAVRYQRIHILGGSGSGKSTVAAKIAAEFGIPAYDLDDLFWDNTASTFDTRADPARRDQALRALVDGDRWVIEGVWYKWVIPSFERADLIIILTPSVWLRHWRVIKRFVLRRLARSSTKKETVASLIRLIRWDHGYEKKVLGPARAVLAELHRSPVECSSQAEVLAILSDGEEGAVSKWKRPRV